MDIVISTLVLGVILGIAAVVAFVYWVDWYRKQQVGRGKTPKKLREIEKEVEVPAPLQAELARFQKIVYEEFDSIPEDVRFITKEQILIAEYIPPRMGMAMMFAYYSPSVNKVVLIMRAIKAIHDPLFYGQKTTEKQMRRHIRNLLIHQGAYAKGWTDDQINNAVKNGFLPIK